jgi:hypothetical protein
MGMTRGHDEPGAMTAAPPEGPAARIPDACWHAVGAPAELARVGAGLLDAGPPRWLARVRKRS